LSNTEVKPKLFFVLFGHFYSQGSIRGTPRHVVCEFSPWGKTLHGTIMPKSRCVIFCTTNKLTNYKLKFYILSYIHAEPIGGQNGKIKQTY